MNTYLYDEFVNVVAGNPIRLFRFGKLVKGGRVRQITKALARRFKIPHFKPAIKLGSHDETTPAGGHLVGLEVRDDGLYGIPQLNDAGRKAMKSGAYKYQSPEVIWDDDKGFEDPESGELISGPLVVGMALLHSPHLGESAELYRVEPLGEKPAPKRAVPVRAPKEEMVAKPKTKAEISKIVNRSIELRAEKDGITYVEAYEAMTAEKPEIKQVLAAGKPISVSAKADRKEALAALVGQVRELCLSGVDDAITPEIAIQHMHDNAFLLGGLGELSKDERASLIRQANEAMKVEGE